MKRSLLTSLLTIGLSTFGVSQVIHKFAALDNNNTFTGSDQFTSPLYLGSGVPISQSNECNSIITDSSGGTVTAVAALRVVVSGVGHDIVCIVTVDATNPTNIGGLVFPGITSFSSTSAASQFVKGTIESLGPSGGAIVATNNGGTSRTNYLNFRACNTLNSACGTDMVFAEDITHTAKEEYTITLTGDGTPLYMGNVLNSTHPGIWFGGSDASTAADFGLDRYLGSFSHIGRLASGNTDTWHTIALTSGTATVTFNRAFTSAPVGWCNNPNQSGAAIACSVNCATGASCTIKSGGGSDTVNYLILGNPI